MGDECGENNTSGECCDGLWCKLWALNYCDEDHASDHQEVIDTFLQSTDHHHQLEDDLVDVQEGDDEEKDDQEEEDEDDDDDFADYDDEELDDDEDDGEYDDGDNGKSLWCQLWPAQCTQPDTATGDTEGVRPAPANSFSKLYQVVLQQ